MIKHDINVAGTPAANIRGKNALVQKSQTEILSLFPLKILKYSSETRAVQSTKLREKEMRNMVLWDVRAGGEEQKHGFQNITQTFMHGGITK